MLFDVLIKFRTKVIALTADIEKAFLQIGIRQEDRDFLRFLWYDDPQSANRSVVQLRYARLPFGLRPSPAVLGSVLLQHVSSYQEKNPEIVKVLKGLFVDDLSTGGETVDKAYEIYQQAKQVMKEGNFNLRKWNSNSKELIERIRTSEGEVTTRGSDPKLSEEDQSYVQSCIGLSAENETVKILGLLWNSSSDEICYDFTEITELAKTIPATKRSLLKLTAKIFDPLGILSVFTVKMKAMFQSLCVQKVAWDEELQGSARLEFNAFLFKLQQLSKVRIPRCLFNELSIRSFQIHGFSDASEQAYACVVYLRTEYENGQVDCRIIASKARVAPIKQVTIPKLELMGALLLAELMHTIRNVLLQELYPEKITSFYWVDSLVALCWVKNSKPWKQFVRNRVLKILELTDRSQWRFCPSVLNPADLPSRGVCGKDLSRNVFWIEGPEFLKQRCELWPFIETTDNEANEIALQEEAKNSHVITHALSSSSDVLNIQSLVNIERFGSKRKLLSTLAWVFRFVESCKASLNNKKLQLSEELRNEEIERAEYKLLSYIQREEFSEEFEFLRGKMVTKPPLKVKQFNLFLDNNNVIRERTRIINASVSDYTKMPILLHPRNWYSKLVIKEYHDIVLHSGVRDTLNAIRQRYWILKGREAVKKFKRLCTVCSWIDRLTIKPTMAPELPDSRVDDGPPFTNTGLNFAGPLLVKDKNSSCKELSKSYICIYSCFSTRAVHLELVDSLNVSSFFRSFRRFCARRGLPRKLYSDNAKTFKAAAKEIKQILNSKSVKGMMVNKGVDWEFIVPKSPWRGGAWERLIRSVKRSLHKVVGRAQLSFDELNTLLVEIESVINSRPLTYIYDDTEGVTYPLTPSQLIYGRNVTLAPNESYLAVVSTHETLTKRLKYHRKLLSEFSKRWKNEYLPSLREILNRNERNENIVSLGDIVIVKNEQTKRSFWKVAKVVELIPSRDGKIRSVKLKVATENGTTYLERPLQCLVPLEVKSNVDEKRVSGNNNVSLDFNESNSDHEQTRPRRTAAVIGELIRKDML